MYTLLYTIHRFRKQVNCNCLQRPTNFLSPCESDDAVVVPFASGREAQYEETLATKMTK